MSEEKAMSSGQTIVPAETDRPRATAEFGVGVGIMQRIHGRAHVWATTRGSSGRVRSEVQVWLDDAARRAVIRALGGVPADEVAAETGVTGGVAR